MGTLVENFQNEDIALFEAIKEFQQGNEEKATYIYENTKKYTYRMIYQNVSRFKSQSVLTGDEGSIAEDVMQELYLDFFKNISKFRNEDPKSFYKWISVVSNRMVFKYVDKNKMEVLQCGQNEDFREDNDIWDATEMNDDDLERNHETLPEAALEDKEFQKLIMDFVQSLPEVQAQTVIYHFYSGMKYQEIADEMGVALITVKTRMKKAQESLKEIVTKYEKKTGTKLHSVSILPMFGILYRLYAESTTVPVAVDAVIASSVATASSVTALGMGSAVTAGATTVTKVIGTKALIAIVSTAVAIGGVAVGSQFIGQKQETVIETEQEDLEEKLEIEDLQDDNLEVDSEETKQEETPSLEPTQNNQAKDETPKQEEKKEQVAQDNAIVILQEDINARKVINQAYRDFLNAGGCEGLYTGPIFRFGVADINGDGIQEMMFYSYNPATGNDNGPDYMMTYDGEVCGAGKGFGSMHNMEYCVKTKHFIQKYYYEDGSCDIRLYNFDGTYFGEESVNLGEREDLFVFYINPEGKYSWGTKDYYEELSNEQQVYIKQKLQEYLPDSEPIIANYQLNETDLNKALPIDDEGIKQQLINEKN